MPQINGWKGFNSLFSLLCVVMLFRFYWLAAIFERLSLVLDKYADARDTYVSFTAVCRVSRLAIMLRRRRRRRRRRRTMKVRKRQL